MAEATMTINIDRPVARTIKKLMAEAFEAGARRTLCSCGTARCKAERELAFAEWVEERDLD